MLDVQKALHRAANALEHIARSLMAIEMMQAAQADGSYEESLHIHQCFQHDGCTACGTKARHWSNPAGVLPPQKSCDRARSLGPSHHGDF